MAPRANWKGFLKIGELVCPVALYTAASSSDRISLHILNRDTGHRVKRLYVDSDTGKPVESEDQVKGYAVAENEYVVLEPDEIAAAVPESTKTLDVEAFVQEDDIDQVYFDKPYYLAPSEKQGEEAFALIRDGLRAKKVAALAQTVLFRRMRTVLIRDSGNGLVANTLNFDYEVRAAADAFGDVPPLKIKGEMLQLAKHIIETKKGKFDPSKYEDRYEAALTAMVKAKIEGKELPVLKERKAENVVDLMEALRMSAGVKKKEAAAKKKATAKVAAKKKTEAPRRKAS
ncbi:putative DNA repair protein YkoV [Variibacter gotjawalensis]|uniref:Non-homologous end joining protein Ku n=1 Tax=Variibacter gotjawalensis TaxID=1333996 RepID=A0A0S3PNX2_9BRAD|nr:DNA end-binding protein Ku [Variibacter gotjawalensis]RZS49786.1 DNA end-binding protein Ku [Variibacter gotjawalensis]BAT57615.1 putative DNA repair protein YkoV [Variibacter gotjawalensis]